MKKIAKVLFKTILIFVGFIFLYAVSAYLISKITIERESDTKSEVPIYILTNGVHTDIVMPAKNDQIDWSKQIKFKNTKSADTTYQYLAMGWGDKGFYLETPEWSDLKASVALKAASGLSTTAIHATYYKSLKEGEDCKKIMISKEQYNRLIKYINESFQKDASGNFVLITTDANYGKTDAFYEANGSYSLLRTCNTWANSGLKSSGQKCCLWTATDSGIFSKYK
ncbi:TIGR02117 family protein [Flavobacterium sp. Fl-77]|uniref:TIGR02117 family protein n=1 Tax=Flavobacterium flavipigmentatum TaxID=2893884 RepID=A0AAJ2SC12_9FLAO|nr:MULTISPECIES: TIGR02117 family protein [unclassified Flavobacterium]MDX6182481.1 TIGR02117 family protein [Flavobacterium sp. Fl-33]MDX6185606.1 TIGR02117 family protein [Flavobacterium sp. Fl-77]UFH38792.1 TIGR02117 family protein [Flavobacterium sp. F-70]